MKINIKSFVSLITISVILVGLNSCKKEDLKLPQDYRDKYIGNYNFRTFINRKYYFFYLTPPRDSLVYDTLDYNGKIEKFDSNKLKIIFNSPNSEPDFTNGPYSINGLIYPTLSDYGTMGYPEMKWSMTFFNGNFFANDSVIFSYGYNSHGVSEMIYTLGKKIN